MPTYAFVNGISASPTILFNLDNQSPFSVVVGTQTPPPSKRYSQSGSTSRDGDNIAQSSYNDRLLTIVLRVELKATAEEQVEGIQKLGRLLDSEQWLMWKHDTMIEPVFFRTRRGDMDIDDYMMVDRPKRTITLSIPAEPFAYGAAVTGSTTISNDPTVAVSSNPMSYVFPAIQGDVAAPVDLKMLASPLVMSSAISVAAGPSVPSVPVSARASSMGTATAGWTTSLGAADTDAFGGLTTLFTKTSGAIRSPAASHTLTSPKGDFRLFVRARTNVSDAVLYTSTTRDASLNTTSNVKLVSGSDYRWYDLGVSRPPRTPEIVGPTPGLFTPFDPSWNVSVACFMDSAAGVIAIDRVLALPAGLDDDVLSSLLILGEVLTATGPTHVLSEEQIAFIDSTPLPRATYPMTIAGGLPRVVPGAKNVLTLVKRIGANDVKSAPITLNFYYYPRYLYIRPATT